MNIGHNKYFYLHTPISVIVSVLFHEFFFTFFQHLDEFHQSFEEKMEVVDITPRIDIKTSKPEWKQDLEILPKRPPKYDFVMKDVVSSLRSSDYEVS